MAKRVNNLDIALIEAQKIYGGKWEISEILNINDYNEKELKKIIILNINS